MQMLQEVECIPFKRSHPLTLGVEVEVQLLDWKTMELCPAAPRLLPLLKSPSFHPEYFQSNLEFVTGVCHSLAEVEADLRRSGTALLEAARQLGVEIVGTGTHPLDGGHRDDPLYPSPRYREVHKRSRWAASYMSTFGLHVHVGVESGSHAMDLIHGAAPYLAHLLALSASSPFTAGKDTGLCSSRVTVYESLPTAGTPPTLATWQDFELLVRRLKRAEAVDSLKDLLWDIRPSPNLGTVEIRICDGQADLRDTLALVTAVRCLFAWLEDRRRSGEKFPLPGNWRLRENKWRAARWGMDARLVVDDEGTVRRAKDEWHDLLEVFQDYCEPAYFTHLASLVRRGPSCLRQREWYEEFGSLRTVLHELAREWREGVLSG